MDNPGENQSRKRFASQLTAHRERVFVWVLNRVGADRAIAEDVTQDCLVRVWETRRGNPPPPGALHTYLLTTAKNLLRDRFRRRKILANGDSESVRIADAETPEGQFLLRETVERLSAEVALMPFLLRETIRLRVEEGLNYTTIATQMNCPLGTVKSRLSAARSHLRNALAKQEMLDAHSKPTVIVTQHRTVSPKHNETTTLYKEQKTMSTGNELAGLRATMREMDERLRALEGTPPEKQNGPPEPWGSAMESFADNLRKKREAEHRAFSLGVVHVILQDGSNGGTTTRLSITIFDSATDLPEDRTLTERRERMRLLTSDDATLRVFRYFYALRFAGKPMRATSEELAGATGETGDKIKDLLKPFVTDETLLLVSDGDGKELYEWGGIDILITTLLFGAV